MGTGMVAGFRSSLNDLWFDFTPFIEEASKDEEGNDCEYNQAIFDCEFEFFLDYVKEKFQKVWPSLYDPKQKNYPNDYWSREFTPFLENDLIQIGWSSDSNFVVFSVRANEDRFDDFRLEQMKALAENWFWRSWPKIQKQFDDCSLDRVCKTGNYTHQLVKKGV